MPPSSHDIPADASHHRKDASRPKEMRPLLTHEPLPHDREKRPPAQPPRQRKRRTPDKPAFTFDPKQSHIPSGKQNPPIPLVYSRPPVSEPYEQQMVVFADREIHGHDGYNHTDPQKRLRISPGFSSAELYSSSYPDTSCTDVNDMSSAPPDPYDSPVSYTSSSSPAPSDQSSGAADIPTQTVAHTAPFAPPPMSMCPYGSQAHGPQPIVHQDTYGYPVDRVPQGYHQYFDPYRAAPHSAPGYSENNNYGSYPPRY